MSPLMDDLELQVSFSDIDSAGVIYFANAFTFAHKAYENWVICQEFGWTNWFQNPNWAVPIVDAQAQYKKPIFGGQRIKIRFSITEIQNSSFISTSQIVDLNNRTELALIKLVHVFMSKETKNKIKIPTEVEKALLSAQQTM
jgi:YbgC/YbaW family acyl-CoA thioester hydrolase